jgi:hypothetical protein
MVDTQRTADPVKLVAFDQDDLSVISAHVQDAVIKVSDMKYLPKERRFAIAMKRFVWEKALTGRRRNYERRQSLLIFDHVSAAQCANLKREDPNTIVELLAVVFEPGEEPGGYLILHFAGGTAVRLQAEAIEARLTDLDVAWATKRLPVHDISDADSAEALTR